MKVHLHWVFMAAGWTALVSVTPAPTDMAAHVVAMRAIAVILLATSVVLSIFPQKKAAPPGVGPPRRRVPRPGRPAALPGGPEGRPAEVVGEGPRETPRVRNSPGAQRKRAVF